MFMTSSVHHLPIRINARLYIHIHIHTSGYCTECILMLQLDEDETISSAFVYLSSIFFIPSLVLE